MISLLFFILIVELFVMNKWNYSNARAQLSMLMQQALAGYPVEITRKGQESVIIISKSSYEQYKKAVFDVTYLREYPSPHDID